MSVGEEQCARGSEYYNENIRLRKALEEAILLKKAVMNLSLFIEPDGKPVDGFRFREIAKNMVTIAELAALGEGDKDGN